MSRPKSDKRKNSSNGSNKLSLETSRIANEKIWADHWAKELKGQREWSHKWASLNDPKLYSGEHAPDTYSTKVQPTRWSVFSVINPPGSKPTLNAPEIPLGCVAPTFKITGERHHFKKAPERNLAWGALPPKTDYTTSSSAYGSLSKSRTVSLKSNLNKDHLNSEAAFHNAPFATATPVSPIEIKKLETKFRASVNSYNSTLVGARAGGKVDFAKDPQKTYKYPATNSMEYGWNWDGRKKLEIY